MHYKKIITNLLTLFNAKQHQQIQKPYLINNTPNPPSQKDLGAGPKGNVPGAC